TLQGHSLAQYEQPGRAGDNWGGSLTVGPAGPPPGTSIKVQTSHLQGGYLRKNGVPYSADASVAEYFDIAQGANGEQYLILATGVTDPKYLTQPFVTSTHFKKQADAAGWNPNGCSAK